MHIYYMPKQSAPLGPMRGATCYLLGRAGGLDLPGLCPLRGAIHKWKRGRASEGVAREGRQKKEIKVMTELLFGRSSQPTSRMAEIASRRDPYAGATR